MWYRIACVVVAFALGAAGLCAPAQAQDSGIPCDAFMKNDDGSWSAIRNVGVPAAGRRMNINQGARFTPGMTIQGLNMASILDGQCPAEPAPLPGTEPISVSPAQVELPKLADTDGNIEAQKLTCAQLADANQFDADFLGLWYVGWHNGLAKGHTINLPKVKAGIRDVIAYCKTNKDKLVVQAVDAVIRDDKR